MNLYVYNIGKLYIVCVKYANMENALTRKQRIKPC